MSFFIRGKNPVDKKRKVVHPKRNKTVGKLGIKKLKPFHDLNEEITSDEDEDYLKGKNKDDEENEKEILEEETAQEKKVRLARQYIKELGELKLRQEEDDELDSEQIGLRLREEVLDAAGKLQRTVADLYSDQLDLNGIRVLKCKQQKLPITCIAVTSDDKFIFSASKDCSIVKWSFTGKKLIVVPGGRKGTEDVHIGHTGHIFALAVSTDSKYLASGDTFGYIHIWASDSMKHLKVFKKHRGAISGLAFRRSTHTLYSSSHDRLVMVWNLDAMAFVENLGGHQDAITGIDALNRESCITSGGRDQSIIIYVIIEDKQLRFSGHQNSIDGVKLVNDKMFVSFGQDGALALWTTLKKRPHFIVRNAHGIQEMSKVPNWITSVATLVNTDLIASGSMDGFIRLWKVDTINYSKIQLLFCIPVKGFINSLAFTSDGKHLIAGIGQEHKLGRWVKDKSAKNCVFIIPLLTKNDEISL